MYILNEQVLSLGGGWGVRLNDTWAWVLGLPLKAAQGALQLSEGPQGASLPVGKCPATWPGRCLSGESNKTWACTLYVVVFFSSFWGRSTIRFFKSICPYQELENPCSLVSSHACLTKLLQKSHEITWHLARFPLRVSPFHSQRSSLVPIINGMPVLWIGDWR